MDNILKAKIGFSSFSRSPVDILIPFHGQYDKVSRLVYSIILAVKSNPYQITLIDDGSPNADYIQQFKDFDKDRPFGSAAILQTLRLEQRTGFATALRHGFDATKQPWVMFLHSDCWIEDTQWMLEMGRSLLSLDKRVKMVGAQLEKQKSSARLSDIILEGENYLPLACAMCHRNLFAHIGGFIRNYIGYEDQELAYRMKYYGYRQAISSNACVRHEGGATYKDLFKQNNEIGELIEQSRNKLIIDLKKFTSPQK